MSLKPRVSIKYFHLFGTPAGGGPGKIPLRGTPTDRGALETSKMAVTPDTVYQKNHPAGGTKQCLRRIGTRYEKGNKFPFATNFLTLRDAHRLCPGVRPGPEPRSPTRCPARYRVRAHPEGCATGAAADRPGPARARGRHSGRPKALDPGSRACACACACMPKNAPPWPNCAA